MVTVGMKIRLYACIVACILEEASWELVRPHLPLLATCDALKTVLLRRLSPDDLLVAFETDLGLEVRAHFSLVLLVCVFALLYGPH